MESNIITWNPVNWVTIVLMVGLTFFIVGAVAKIVQQRNGNGG